MELNESYKKRLKYLAGLNEEMFINPDGEIEGLELDGTIPEDKQFIYSVTYQTVTPESAEHGDYDDQGFEVEDTQDSFEFIIEQAKYYGVSEPSSSRISGGESWSSVDPERNYQTGEEKYYSLHIKNLDGSKLNQLETEYVNSILNPGRRR